MKGSELLRSYFHCQTNKYRRRSSAVIVCTAAFFAEIALISFFVLFFNMFSAPDSDIMLQMTVTAGASLFIGLALCLAVYEINLRIIRRKSRYTYLDIQLKAIVYSRYSGDFRILGHKKVYRELYIIPLKEFKAAEYCKNGKNILIKGKIRHYSLESDNLGYHIRNGDIEMDKWWLNHGGFSEEESVVITDRFGETGRIISVIEAAKKRFDSLPPPKAYQFKEADFIRKRPKPRVLPDSFDFSRTWQ